MLAKRFLVTGRVQGVYYRASTRQQAVRLGIVGHAKNLPDGRVEVLALGAPAALEILEQWLWQGPPAAEVSEVVGEEIEVSLVADRVSGFATH